MEFKENFIKELIFTVVCIISANVIGDITGVQNLPNAIVGLLFMLGMLIYLKRRNLLSYYGISSLKKLNYKNLLFLIPMVLIVSVNLWGGAKLNYSIAQHIYIAVAMIGVGFAEEILFRSFLVKALMNNSRKLAIILPSMLFGFIHLANIIGGADFFSTILQALYATAFGFTMVMFFVKTNNIIPCMICHSLSNITDAFIPKNSLESFQIIGCAAFIAISAFYGFYLLGTRKDLKCNYELRKLSSTDGRDIYDMLQEIPKDENGFINNAFGKSYEEYK